MRIHFYLRRADLLGLLPLLYLSLQAAHAGSATWNLNPTSGDWNTATNWTPATVPNATIDVATFGASNTTSILTSANVDLASWLYGARPIWWVAGAVGAVMSVLWNYAMSTLFVWRAR